MSVTLALITAVGLTLGRFPGRTMAITFLMSPLILPSIVVGLALLLFFNTVWPADYHVGLVIGHVIISFPYALRSILPQIETFDRNLWAASRTLGARPIISFLTILMPLAMPGIISGTIFAFLIFFDNYNVSVFIQDPVAPTLPVVLYNAAEQALNPVLMAVSSVLVILSALVVSAFSKYLIHGK
nr:ABC transporter permease subunit [Rhizobium sp. ACO-34A]